MEMLQMFVLILFVLSFGIGWLNADAVGRGARCIRWSRLPYYATAKLIEVLTGTELYCAQITYGNRFGAEALQTEFTFDFDRDRMFIRPCIIAALQLYRSQASR
jgi:hypothetical protein